LKFKAGNVAFIFTSSSLNHKTCGIDTRLISPTDKEA
jgi:hypothetical protein